MGKFADKSDVFSTTDAAIEKPRRDALQAYVCLVGVSMSPYFDAAGNTVAVAAVDMLIVVFILVFGVDGFR